MEIDLFVNIVIIHTMNTTSQSIKNEPEMLMGFFARIIPAFGFGRTRQVDQRSGLDLFSLLHPIEPKLFQRLTLTRFVAKNQLVASVLLDEECDQGRLIHRETEKKLDGRKMLMEIPTENGMEIDQRTFD